MKRLSSLSDEMREHVQNYKSSGKSLMAYCQDVNLSYSTMKYWYYKKYKQGASTKSTKGFTEVTSPAKALNNVKPAVEIILPNGIQINFNSCISSELLKALL